MSRSTVQRPRRRKLLRFVFLVVVIAFVGYPLRQYPRRVLLSDMRDSERITVDWRVRAEDGNFQRFAYELDDTAREAFEKTLSQTLALDYGRLQATAPPTIGIYLVGEDSEAYYAVRYARNITRSLPMESLRNIAAKGRQLSEDEVAAIFDDDLRSKWPHILPWPEFRYDYVLPSQ